MYSALRDLSNFLLVTIVELNKIKLNETSNLYKYRDAGLRTWRFRPDLPNSTIEPSCKLLVDTFWSFGQLHGARYRYITISLDSIMGEIFWGQNMGIITMK